MGLKTFYEEAILSRLIRCACGDPKIMRLRAKLVPLAEGKVFELGVGGGLNQPFYDPQRVTAFAGIDPGANLLDLAKQAALEKGWESDIRHGHGEDIPFADDSFDTVVSTFTMCSVDDQRQVLAELLRILRPGGRFLYLEHGRAPDPAPARWQRIIEPAWKRMMGNCHLTRPVSSAIADAGFAIQPAGERYLEKMPRWVGWMEWGVGIKQG
ncbi:class I SAM-dependent methyltransferase [Altererythrobacter sp. TH136]|uniref:class I SAM-dependent methyltransferase n=1 Tax=Altererythrobacter sp. TH136 TaxID=2067415 RepID=UPI001161F2CA|nr:class I SAM-dependent methyltransferase [Altererythrobacter sp. TH136]QDM40382.1 class I SAM-dependent methyltransferase [Altererythrobacter sp. TH136]